MLRAHMIMLSIVSMALLVIGCSSSSTPNTPAPAQPQQQTATQKLTWSTEIGEEKSEERLRKTGRDQAGIIRESLIEYADGTTLQKRFVSSNKSKISGKFPVGADVCANGEAAFSGDMVDDKIVQLIGNDKESGKKLFEIVPMEGGKQITFFHSDGTKTVWSRRDELPLNDVWTFSYPNSDKTHVRTDVAGRDDLNRTQVFREDGKLLFDETRDNQENSTYEYMQQTYSGTLYNAEGKAAYKTHLELMMCGEGAFGTKITLETLGANGAVTNTEDFEFNPYEGANAWDSMPEELKDSMQRDTVLLKGTVLGNLFDAFEKFSKKITPQK